MHRSRQDVRQAEPRLWRWWRGLTGSLAAGLVVLTLVVLTAELLSWPTDSEGPGRFTVFGHVVASVLVIAGQCLSDRMRGGVAALAGGGVVGLTCVVLWIYWWA